MSNVRHQMNCSKGKCEHLNWISTYLNYILAGNQKQWAKTWVYLWFDCWNKWWLYQNPAKCRRRHLDVCLCMYVHVHVSTFVSLCPKRQIKVSVKQLGSSSVLQPHISDEEEWTEREEITYFWTSICVFHVTYLKLWSVQVRSGRALKLHLFQLIDLSCFQYTSQLLTLPQTVWLGWESHPIWVECSWELAH